MALKDKEVLIPALKTGLSVLSSAAADSAAGWAGILSGGSLEAMDQMRDRVQYVPEEGSKAGGYLKDLSYAMEPIGIAADQLNAKFGDTVYDLTGSPMLAAGAKAVPEALMSLGGLKSLKLQSSAMNPDIKPSSAMVEKAVTRTLDPFNLHKGANPVEAKMYVGPDAKGVPPINESNILKTGEQGVGWRMGPDEKMRFQISDIDAEFKLDPEAALNQRHGAPIANIIKHDKLFEMYPDLAKVKVFKTSNPKENGHFQAKWNNKGEFDGARIALNTRGKEQADIMGTMLHEIQHWVQVREGFSPGSSPDKFKKLKTEVLPGIVQKQQDAMKAYENVGVMMERAKGDIAKNTLKGRQTELFTEIQKQQQQIKILQRLRKSKDGWNYDRTLGEMEARDTTDMWMRERLGLDMSKGVPTINRRKTDVGGAHENIIIDPSEEALMLPAEHAGGLRLKDIRNVN